MSLAAGQRTVPDDFLVHSCHCYFLLAGAGDQPILFHVELVRDGRSFATRTVQARQRGRCIFTVTASFVRADSSGAACVSHAAPMPTAAAAADGDGTEQQDQEGAERKPLLLLPPTAADEAREPAAARQGPFVSHPIGMAGGRPGTAPTAPHAQRLRMWVKARGRVSARGGHRAHLNALAYISDSYFIGTVARIHRLWRFPFPAAEFGRLPEAARQHVRQVMEWEGAATAGGGGGGGGEEGEGEGDNWDVGAAWADRPEVGIMVSLDHTIYFHAPARVRADEWMLCEMESPWADDGRALVMQRIFARDGTLLATCVQEVSDGLGVSCVVQLADVPGDI